MKRPGTPTDITLAYVRDLESYCDHLESVRRHLDERNIYLNSNTPDPETIRKAKKYDELMERFAQNWLDNHKPSRTNHE